MSKVNVSLNDEVLEMIDEARKEMDTTRSSFIEKASIFYLERLEEKKREREKQEGIEKACRLQDEVREKVGYFDGLAQLKKWRNARR